MLRALEPDSPLSPNDLAAALNGVALKERLESSDVVFFSNSLLTALATEHPHRFRILGSIALPCPHPEVNLIYVPLLVVLDIEKNTLHMNYVCSFDSITNEELERQLSTAQMHAWSVFMKYKQIHPDTPLPQNLHLGLIENIDDRHWVGLSCHQKITTSTHNFLTSVHAWLTPENNTEMMLSTYYEEPENFPKICINRPGDDSNGIQAFYDSNGIHALLGFWFGNPTDLQENRYFQDMYTLNQGGSLEDCFSHCVPWLNNPEEPHIRPFDMRELFRCAYINSTDSSGTLSDQWRDLSTRQHALTFKACIIQHGETCCEHAVFNVLSDGLHRNDLPITNLPIDTPLSNMLHTFSQSLRLANVAQSITPQAWHSQMSHPHTFNHHLIHSAPEPPEHLRQVAPYIHDRVVAWLLTPTSLSDKIGQINALSSPDALALPSASGPAEASDPVPVPVPVPVSVSDEVSLLPASASASAPAAVSVSDRVPSAVSSASSDGGSSPPTSLQSIQSAPPTDPPPSSAQPSWFWGTWLGRALFWVGQKISRLAQKLGWGTPSNNDSDNPGTPPPPSGFLTNSETPPPSKDALAVASSDGVSPSSPKDNQPTQGSPSLTPGRNHRTR